jgi:hypothetical protein
MRLFSAFHHGVDIVDLIGMNLLIGYAVVFVVLDWIHVFGDCPFLVLCLCLHHHVYSGFVILWG